jgi:hypothetical protein
MSQTSEIKENAKNYFCECCQYQTYKKYNFDKHLLTKKHARKMNGEESVSSEPKIKRTRKTNKCMSDISTQTEEVESIISDITTDDTSEFELSVEVKCIEMSTQTDDIPSENEIELENKNATLEDEVYELKYEIEQKNEEIENITISISNKYEAQIDKLKEENEYKTIKIESLMETINNLRLNINELMDENEQLKQQKCEVSIAQNEIKCTIIDDNTNQSKSKSKLKNNLTLSKIIDENKNEENDKEIKNKEFEMLKEQVEKQNKELERSNENIKQLTNILLNGNEPSKKNKNSSKDHSDGNNNVKLRVDRDVNNYRDTKNMMDLNQFRRLCKNPNFNKYIRYYNHLDIDGNEQNVLLLNNMDILEQGSDTDKYSEKTYENEIYLDCLIDLFKSVNYRHIPFICTNIKNLIFKVFDFEKKEWILLKNKNEFANYIKIYVNILSGFLLKATNNMTNNDYINNSVYNKFYGVDRAKYITGNYLYVLRNIVNPLGDESKFEKNKTAQCELFINSLINQLSNIFNMNIEHFTKLEDYDETIDIEIDYYYDLDIVKYEPCHHNLVTRYIKKTNYWDDD